MAQDSNAADPSPRDAFAAELIGRLQSQDEAARNLGIAVEAIGMGWCRLSMRVRPDMLNGYKVSHGGYIFTLADTAMAYASNGANQTMLAQNAQITFLSPGKADEVLIAEAREVSRAKRSGLYDVDVRGEDGRMVAAFRGGVRSTPDPVDPDMGEPPA